jgi:hypothetical protein
MLYWSMLFEAGLYPLPPNPLKASWRNPHGDSMAVAFIYGRFGVAFCESTPYIAVRVLPCPPKTVMASAYSPCSSLKFYLTTCPKWSGKTSKLKKHHSWCFFSHWLSLTSYGILITLRLVWVAKSNHEVWRSQTSTHFCETKMRKEQHHDNKQTYNYPPPPHDFR